MAQFCHFFLCAYLRLPSAKICEKFFFLCETQRFSSALICEKFFFLFLLNHFKNPLSVSLSALPPRQTGPRGERLWLLKAGEGGEIF
jgi:hypothetical protein